MATERKFAISTTPGQPGYEATYSTVNAWLSAIGGRDLVANDEKMILEIFSDYVPGVYSWTGRVDFRFNGWNGDRTTDNYLVIQAAPGHEFVYPDRTGAMLRGGGVDQSWFRIDNNMPIDFFDIGLISELTDGGAANPIYEELGDVRSGIMDRCFIEHFATIDVSLFIRFTNIIFNYIRNPGSNGVINGGNVAGGVINSITAIATDQVLSGGTLFFRNHLDIDNCVFVKQAGSGYGLGFGSSSGDNNASTDNTAPGGASLQNIVEADEFVSTSDYHLKETSNLRDAGQNFFGNGYDRDIDRDDRPNAAWDIGADQFTGAAPTPTPQNAIFFGTDF